MVCAAAGLFIVLEREGEIIATGAYKPKDRHTAEIKRIWTHRRSASRLAAKVVRAGATGGAGRVPYLPDHRFPSAGGGKAISAGMRRSLTSRETREYSQPPYDGRLRFTKALVVSAYSHSA